MALHKYSSFDLLSAEVAHGGNRGLRRAMARHGLTPGDHVTRKVAHRHNFEYEPRPGYIYVRSRAISSRCNDNYDEFPGPEIKQAYRSFVGKPVFVNHHNEDHRRMRGVIIDAALHEDINPDGTEDTWTEVLMEVDASNFPMLAKAILAGEIDRTSMGCDVAYSKCSFCGNKAATPLDYCKHIPAMKGQRIRRTTASGTKEDVLVREICYGLSFFENSLLVEDPADPTAFFLGVDDHSKTASLQATAARQLTFVHPQSGQTYTRSTDAAYTHVSFKDGQIAWHLTEGAARRRSDTVYRIEGAPTPGQPDSEPCPNCLNEAVPGIITQMTTDGMRSSTCHLCNGEGTISRDSNGSIIRDARRTGNSRKVASRRLALDETTVPLDVDTLADSSCPVCNESDAFNGDECGVCGYIKPPDPFMDPDLDLAHEVDLRQDAGEDIEIDENSRPGEDEADKPRMNEQFSLPKPESSRTSQEEDMRPALQAIARQQKKINRQDQQILALRRAVYQIATLAGLERHPSVVAVVRKHADEDNPAQPVLEPAEEAPEATTDETIAPITPSAPSGGSLPDDVTTPGATSETEVAPATTTTVDTDFGTELDVTPYSEDQDVTAPVAGTTGPRPLDEVRIETDVRYDQESANSTEEAFPIEAEGFEPMSTGASKRAFAALRLARLQVQAGVESGDDITLGTAIASSRKTDSEIAAEITTLSKVLSVKAPQHQTPQRQASRRLVPQGAASGRQMPSLAAVTAGAGGPDVVTSVTDDEILW